jgi:hypothetical protein
MTQVFNRKQKRSLKAQFKRDNKKWPEKLKLVDASDTEDQGPGIVEVWRSKDFLVQVYEVNSAVQRISVSAADFSLPDDISWDTLQRIKRETGRGEWEAVEIYPADADEINVGDQRHLWVFKGLKLPFGFGGARGNSKTAE